MNNMFTSQAGNFFSALQSGVDPRTGQFNVNFPLAHFNANNLLGPQLDLTLSYSPLNNNNIGFGTGFSFGLTQFNYETNLLELSNGEKYRVESGTNIIRNKKLNNFSFNYANGNSDENGYIVVWKNGKKEYLTAVADGQTFVTTKMTSPTDREITLTWGWSGSFPLLESICDEQRLLCNITYDTIVNVIIWPSSAEEYALRFALQNNDTILSNISRVVSDSETLYWLFDYSYAGNEDSSYQLTKVTFPTGVQEFVNYNSVEGLSFPDNASLSWLPVVAQHTRVPGAGQVETVTDYEYTSHNFLGYNSDFGSWSENSDYIFTTLTDYTYGSTETVTCAGVTVTTRRTYNNYHFLVLEEVTRDGCSQLTQTDYYAEKNTFIDGQPLQFQLPCRRTITWMDSEGHSRQEITLSEFDEYGNPIREVRPDGTTVTTAWYDAKGEEGCPAEPNGFVRFMKQQLITPPATDYDVPVQSTQYAYVLLGDTHYVVQQSKSAYSGDTLLNTQTTTYENNKSSREFGRVSAITNKIYDLSDSSKSYSSMQTFVTTVNNGVMTQNVVFTGHDGLRTTVERVQSIYSGRIQGETNVQGIKTRYVYDGLGRLLTRTHCPDSGYENTTTWSYMLTPDAIFTTETNASGNAVRTYFDGNGRIISQHQYDADTSSSWREIQSYSHNALGEAASSERSDWWIDRTNSPVQCVMTAKNTYDGWGAITSTTFTDGISDQQVTSAVYLTRTISQHGTVSNNTLKSGAVLTQYDVSQRPLSVTRIDTSGAMQGERKYEYDGLGRLRREEDELGNIILRTYDIYGRVVTQTLPDGSVVSRTYAPHLTGNNVASISVTGPDNATRLMGTQTFDSLGRLTASISGGRITTYTYDGVSPVPATVTTPAGDLLNYTYIPELDNAISSITAKDLTQVFTYHPVTGWLIEAKETNGAAIIREWYPSGSLKAETTKSVSGVSRSTNYAWTQGGQPIKCTDITGAHTQYARDVYGRVINMSDSVLSVALNYDALGRLSTQTVTDTVTQASLTTKFTYDDFGCEVGRMVTDSVGTVVNVTQAWRANGQLAARVTYRNGETVRTEVYGYDVRNRLVSYTVNGSTLPHDPYGNEMAVQTFSYDVLNNLTSVITTLSNGTTNTATYQYENDKDPTQLTKVKHTHKSYPAAITLNYDANGRMTQDEAGRILKYDVTGRLVSVSGNNVSGGTYGYDALNRLVSQNVNHDDLRELYYRGDELVNEVLTSQSREIRLIKMGHSCFGVSDAGSLTLVAGDQKSSTLWSRKTSENSGTLHAWSPYGSGKPASSLPGFNGERLDPVSGTYHLGNGYRAYNPVLMRFNCPDSLSPFGAGGINPYAYCVGDPINLADPSGHLSGQAIAGIVLGSIGLLAAIFTAGASIAAAGGVMAAIESASAVSLAIGAAGVVSDVTAIASGAAEDINPEASSVLGWVSLGFGIAGLAGVGAAKALASRGSYKVAKAMRASLGEDNILRGPAHWGGRGNGNGLGVVTHDHLANAPAGSRWHSIRQECMLNKGHYVFGADKPVAGRELMEPLGFFARRNSVTRRPINILSGSHGYWHGDNWTASAGFPNSIRDPGLLEWRFYFTDVNEFGQGQTLIGMDSLKGRIRVINMDGMTGDEFGRYVLNKNEHVILAYCYGRNDEALRFYRNLPPVVSYG
ncbi:RHS repeat-associated core domain-containing protein [Photorhabdus luminescens]|uniref:Type IV secretion protein Rhs n=1 Tax=Photorhabdus luminescens subsp. mexicana TaxID=2100167 RepID=A0A4R4JQZ7_PHOLU|nr:RHS repeat-associated core domain-containing protein [Photorhabdus luminescens]TDB56121.1 type IV secretion protein Rhs [Photorhabdus luminescens subsp. mexicana]